MLRKLLSDDFPTPGATFVLAIFLSSYTVQLHVAAQWYSSTLIIYPRIAALQRDLR